MADLSTIVTTDPTDAEAVSAGASRIREIKDAIVNSFSGSVDTGTGTTLGEHYKRGFHKFLSGAPAALPTPGNNGRIFLDTTNNVLMRDNGTTWTMLGATFFTGTLANGANTVIGTSFTTVVTLNITAITGGRLILLGFLPLTYSAPSTTYTYQITPPGGGGSPVPQQAQISGAPGGYLMQTNEISILAPSPVVTGAYLLQAKVASGTGSSPGGANQGAYMLALQI